MLKGQVAETIGARGYSCMPELQWRGSYKRFLLAALEEGVILVPDGRAYVSAAHTERDVAETLEKLDRAFGRL